MQCGNAKNMCKQDKQAKMHDTNESKRQVHQRRRKRGFAKKGLKTKAKTENI